MEIPPVDLAPIRELYGRGLYIQALRAAEPFGPLHQWSNTPARLLGGRLAIQLGGARLGRWLHLRAYRDTPAHPEAIYYHARYRLERFGPLGAWRFMRMHPEQDWKDAAPEVRADWFGLHAFVCGRLRDFDRAERWLSRAESLLPDRAWVCVERAAVLEFAEKHEAALASARRSQELVPWFRPGVQSEAHLLQQMGRDQEALERLTEAAERIESSIVVAHLAAIQIELRHFNDARRSYERYAELSPLRDKESEKWLAARRSDTAYFTSDIAATKEQAAKAGEAFYTAFAERLERGEIGTGTVRIDMPKSPAGGRPSTLLDQLSHYWKIQAKPAPADLLSLDGLHDVRERLWAEENGLRAIEFTLAPATAFDLIERQIPFLLTLVDAGYSHSQLVVGCDRSRNSVWLIDGNDRRPHEAPLSILAERYASLGPRALLVILPTESPKVEGIEFPDRTQYDQLHDILRAIHRHDRAAAVEAYEGMKAADTGHRLTRLGRLAIARYDANPTLMLHAVDALLALAPDDSTFQLTRLNVLRDLGRREERTEASRRQTLRKGADPLFAHHYAQALLTDPSRLEEAERLMRKAVRQRPFAPAGYYILGNILWEQRHFQEATDVYRFAASLEDRDEQFAEAYFRAARAMEQGQEAMRFIHARYERTRGKVAGPARAEFYALSEDDDMDTAFAALEACWSNVEASQPGSRDPREVGEVLLFAAEMKTNYNDPTAGARLLEQARPLAARPAWLRSAARHALVKADLVEARRCWEELLRDDPLAIDVHRNLSRAIADLEGRVAAVAWVQALSKKYPHFYPLHQLLIDWYRGETVDDGEPSPAEPVIRRLIDLCPDDAWAHRELALHLANHGRPADAFPELEIAKKLEPDSPSYFYTLGHALNRDDRPREARKIYEEAVRRSVDNEVAIVELFALARGETERTETIEFVADELKRQRILGDGLLAFREQAVQAHDAIEPDDLLRLLQDIFDEHPEFWQAWSVVIQQYLLVGRFQEAHELAKEAVERFPLLARLWVDLAEVCQALEDQEGQIRALRQAVMVAPGWSYAARELADAMEANEEIDEARVILEQAVARTPLDPVNHGYLADNLWSAAEEAEAQLQEASSLRHEAIERLRIALKIDPGYDWAWRHLGIWTEQLGEPDRATDIAREVCRLRPGDPRGWLALARMLSGPESNEEVLAALDRAIELNPRGLEAYDLKAERLAEMGRYDEAKAAAMPAIFEHDPPMILQGRAAWVEARRGNFPLACREMQALVTLEPTYYWGWQQLAEWYNESGKPAEFLEATEKLVELRPDNPIALAMRGEARLQNDDREGGKEDLRDAQQLEPGYSYPGMLLFDAHLQDEEYREAGATLAVLEEHIGAGGRPYVLARYAQLAARKKDEDAAAAAFAELVTLPCDSTWPISASVAELRQAGWQHQVDRILRETLEKGDAFHPWILMAWLESKDGMDADPESKLQIVRRVVEVHPRYAQAYDVLGELLTRLGRYDEALRACHPKAWGDRPPLILRGRAAWIIWQRGDHASAIAQMRDIVTADPDYYWGWQQLANWYDEEEATSDYLEATEQLVRLGPNDPSAFGYRGEARTAAGDRRGAKSDFRRAFELDPTYAFAGISLFDAQMTDDELDEAERTLARLEEHVGGPHVQLRALRVKCARKDQMGGAEVFRTLIAERDVPPFVISKAASIMIDAGMTDSLDEAVTAAVEDDPSEPVARLFVERANARGDWSFLERLPALMDRGEAGTHVLHAALDALNAPAHRQRLHDLLRRYGEEIRKSDRGWAKATAALVSLHDFDAAATWASDWQVRKPTEPWMLHPLTVALRQLGRIHDAHRVTEYAVDLPDADATTIDFRIWLAFEEALEGRPELADRMVAGIDVEDLDDNVRVLFALITTLTRVLRQGKAKFAPARDEGLEAIQQFAPKQPDQDLILSYKRWSRRLVSAAGGIGPWLWWLLRGKKLPPTKE